MPDEEQIERIVRKAVIDCIDRCEARRHDTGYEAGVGDLMFALLRSLPRDICRELKREGF